MALHHWRDQDAEQLRDVAGRIATLIQTETDRQHALTRLAQAAERRNALADLLIEYSSRWFHETDGQSMLVGPDLYWILTEPDTDDERTDPGAAKRVRGLLLISVLDNLARNQWQSASPAELAAPSELPQRQRHRVTTTLNSKVVNLQPTSPAT